MSTIIGEALPNIPWQEKPEGTNSPVWRYSANPIIPRNAIPNSNSVFNSAVIPFEGGFAGVFRCDSRSVSMDIFAGFSEDGVNWKINHEPIVFEGDEEITKREYRYDPRVCKIDDRYYVSWCNGYHGPTIGLAYTFDFKTFHQLENAFLPYNRNGVLLPRKIGGNYAMLSRPSDTGHTPFGDIFYSESPDLTFWGKHRYVMGTVDGDASAWQSKKIGPGPIPIETDKGWLLIYHGVINTCNGFVYRMGVALLDLEQPWKVKARSRNYILGPEELYECVGDVPNVTFPCAALTDAATGRIAIYYGCADTVTGLAFTTVDELISYMDEYPLEIEG
ncbi:MULTISPECIES: glycoside hydrolase family 130 protein [unclassified Paenibacillus]|uniref:glycoside hydrolase family 130 protein n=1 Tax=unclassified Paenibacillus TaxID=185978 RepID=UPI0003E28DC8|nr:MULTISPECIES: glycoside hydrolase family 130 protein [unclassified Paenibacillus]ETT40362.1 glycosidase-like protein [Paenibacillus sp. FSL R7-269]OMF86662.1 glycosidase [Paenibacillus sp. FSL R7-0337]